MRKTPAFTIVSMLMMVGLTYLLLNHLQYVVKFTNLAVLYTIMFIHLAVKTFASLAAPVHTVADGVDLGKLSVDVVVPIYNEDPSFLAAGIGSIADQLRKPRMLWLIDDGSMRDGEPFLILEEPEVRRAIRRVRYAGIRVEVIRQENRGKRHAQANAFELPTPTSSSRPTRTPTCDRTRCKS